MDDGMSSLRKSRIARAALAVGITAALASMSRSQRR